LIHINITFLAKLQTSWISVFVLDFVHHLLYLVLKKETQHFGSGNCYRPRVKQCTGTCWNASDRKSCS